MSKELEALKILKANATLFDDGTDFGASMLEAINDLDIYLKREHYLKGENMKAKEMFEKLGYEKDNDIKNERIIYKWEDSLEIIFSLKEKEVWLERIGDTSGEYILEINEHLAIHQQIIELGFIK